MVVQDDFFFQKKEYLCVLDPTLGGKLYHATFMRSLLEWLNVEWFARNKGFAWLLFTVIPPELWGLRSEYVHSHVWCSFASWVLQETNCEMEFRVQGICYGGPLGSSTVERRASKQDWTEGEVGLWCLGYLHSSWGWKPETKVSLRPCSLWTLEGRILAWLFQLLKGSSNPWAVNASLQSLSSQDLLPECLFSSSYKVISHIGLELILTISC